jgi:hypothetical protein
MVAYTKDNALVAKYPPRADKQASSSTGGKASANVAMPAKHPQEVGQHALVRKASTKEGTKEPTAAKHLSRISPAAKQLPGKKRTRPLRQSIRSREGPLHSWQ